MVLELLINPRRAERNPWEMALIGFVYVSVAIVLSMWVFREQTGLVMVFLTVLACTHLIHGTISYEEKKDLGEKREVLLLKEHSKALAFFMFLFIGMVVAFSLWYIILPHNVASDVFGMQMNAISAVNGKVTNIGFFGAVLLNNMKVLFFCVLFAFFYGSGAVFILAWNASVVGTAIGNFVRNEIALLAQSAGLVNVSSYFSIYSIGLMRYMTHGVLEILAYFTAALGAGIISIALARHEFGSKKFYHVLADSADLLMLSIALLIAAALVEAYVTPLLF